MSILTDMAIEASHFPEPPVTDSERKLVDAYKWGWRDLAWLRQKLGARAPFVLSSLLVGPEVVVSSDGTTRSGLDGVSTAELLAELDRRNSG